MRTLEECRMSNTNTLHNFESKTQTLSAPEVTSKITTERQWLTLMTLFMVLGAIIGGNFGMFSLSHSHTFYTASTVLMSTISQTIAGAALGQVAAGVLHVCLFGSIDDE